MEHIVYLAEFDILVEVCKGDFRLTCGSEIVENLDWESASKEIGHRILEKACYKSNAA